MCRSLHRFDPLTSRHQTRAMRWGTCRPVRALSRATKLVQLAVPGTSGAPSSRVTLPRTECHWNRGSRNHQVGKPPMVISSSAGDCNAIMMCSMLSCDRCHHINGILLVSSAGPVANSHPCERLRAWRLVEGTSTQRVGFAVQ